MSDRPANSRVFPDVSVFPYSEICAIVVTYSTLGYSLRASGVVIGPHTILTASHLLWQATSGTGNGTFASAGSTPDKISVYPGYAGSVNGSQFSGSAINGAYLFHYQPLDDSTGYLTPDQSQYDYAVIDFGPTVNFSQYFGLTPNYPGGTLVMSGYDNTAGTAQAANTMSVTRDPNFSVLNYDNPNDPVRVFPGDSGGPLWIENGFAQPSVVGIVSTLGFAMQITPAVINQIDAWQAQDSYSAADPLVDPFFYDPHYPDVFKAGLAPGFHYDNYGWHEGRDPNAFFSTTGYLAANHDVAQAGSNPLNEYDQLGWKQGRDPSTAFDTTLYLMHNPDVAQAGVDPLMHFLHYGQQEGRATYAAIGPAQAIHAGFDPEYYLLANPDVAASGMDPWAHFSTYGWKEMRNPDAIFNTRDYLAAYPDVAAAKIDPLLHFDEFGWREGRDPSATFDTRAYLAHYSDVAAAGVDPLQHYLQFGVYEGRSTFPDGHFG